MTHTTATAGDPADGCLQGKMMNIPIPPSVLPTYLQGTIYRTPELTHLLRILNTPSEHECVAVREVIDELLAHGGTTRRLLELVKAFSEPVFSLTLVKGGGIEEVLALPAFSHMGGVLNRLFTSKDPWRLKRCIECGQYFFDATQNGTSLHYTDAPLSGILQDQLRCGLQRREAFKPPGRSYGSSLIPVPTFQAAYAEMYHQLWHRYGDRPSQLRMANELGISERTLRRYIARDKLPWPPA
jgi:hypothetical protein